MGKQARQRWTTNWYISTATIICILIWILWDTCFFISTELGSYASSIEFAKWSNIPYDLSLNVTIPLRRNDPNAIIFVKTFKTGGSTLTSLFHNYCILHNKSCPITKPYYLSRTWEFAISQHKNDVLTVKTWNGDSGKNGNTFDMWINHVLFHPYLYELLPTANNQILSIVRNPIDRFISGFRYYRRTTTHISNMNISTYIDKLYDNYTKYGKYQDNIDPTPHIGYQINSQCRSLIRGYSELIHLDIYNAWNSIKTGDWLLLITERFDESLLLLKYAYNLTFNDLVYVRQKGNAKRFLYENEYNPTKNERKIIKKLNDCDWKLYQLTMKIFDYRLYEIYKGDGNRKQNDLDKIRKVRSKKQMQCIALKKNEINESNFHEHNIESILEYRVYKILICHSLNKDNVLWNKWAHQYLHNHTFRLVWQNRLISGQSVCEHCVILH